jgi:CheY-like chemotaxis protein
VQDKPGILLVDDNHQIRTDLARGLSTYGGFQVFQAGTASAALDLAKRYPTLRFIVLDIMIEDYAPFSKEETDDGRLTGITLLREFSNLLPKAKVYLKTQGPYKEIYDFAQRYPSVIYVDTRLDLDRIAARAEAIYSDGGMRPEILVVHGHDDYALRELLSFIKDELKLGEAKILRALPNKGRTIIEKFEFYAFRADLVFALLTDDDLVGNKLRARQNVIFEIGYFIGAFGRKSGRLLVLKKGEVEVPSDMDGLVFININNGVGQAGDAIRQELSGWWGIESDSA